MSLEVSAQAARVSSAVSALQDEILQRMHSQQQELQKLRVQQQSLQETMAVQFQRPREDCNEVTTEAVNSQLRDIVSELKTMHKDPEGKDGGHMGSPLRTTPQFQADNDVMLVLKELREEKAKVAEMLDNVKTEKCEVIAMMHAFAMSKGEAIDELEGLRRVACEEVQAAADLVRRVVSSSGGSSRQQQEVPSTCRSTVRDIVRDEEERALSMTQPLLLQGRQGSRTSLCAGSLQPQASAPMPLTSTTTAMPTQGGGGVTIMTMQGVQQQQQQQHQQQQQQPVAVIATTQSMVQGAQHDWRTSAAHGDSALRRVRSPTRQYSAGGAGLLPVSVACSPPMLPRPTTAVETQKSPVRRFISAGLSPRVQDAVAPSQGWASISQATLIR